MSDKRAIIDIGSNTVRLVIYNGPPRAPVVLLNEKVTARLGKDVGRTGLLSDKARETALAALARFITLLRLRGIDNVQTVATAAVRDARNGAEFLKEVAALGLSPRLLSGEEEARASAMGVVAAFPGARGVVGDLGGGSLELVAINGESCEGGITLPFGTLRLPDLRRDGPGPFEARLKEGLKAAGWSHGAGLPLFIVGGSWRALALHAMDEIGWPLDDPHDFELSPGEAVRICAPLARGKVGQTHPRISSSRLATMPDAAALLSSLLELLAPARIVFSSWGLREGLVYNQLDDRTRALDPMLEGIMAFAEDSHVSRRSAEEVAAWTAGVGRGADAPDANLRLGATMLALASMRTEPNMRAEQAMDWALRKRWIGLNARGRAMMAMTVFANTGHCEIPSTLAPLASTADFEQAIVWGLAIRVCRKLTGGTSAALDHSALGMDQNNLVLNLDPGVEALFNSSVAKNMRILADRLGMDWTVRVSSPSQQSQTG